MPVISVLTHDAVPGSVTGIVSGALRRAEAVLLGGGQQTARRNAWDAVCENRRQALDRVDYAADYLDHAEIVVRTPSGSRPTRVHGV